MKSRKSAGIIIAFMLLLVIAAFPTLFGSAQGAVREVNDINILDAVERELTLDTAVLLNNIDVAVAQGVVTLTGSVTNVLAKDRAARVVEDKLWWSPFVDEEDIEVSVENGTATLTGTVESWSEHSAANENAFEGGAAWVNNELVVEVE